VNKVKIALISPSIVLCDPEYNATVLAKEAALAAEAGAQIIAFPELALTGATAGDLYFQEVLTDAAESALAELCDAIADVEAVCLVGLPVRQGATVYNAVCAIYGGEIIGVSAACGYSPSKSQFSPAPDGRMQIVLAGQRTTLGGDLVYGAPVGDGDTRVKIFVKIGDDKAPIPDGVNLVVNTDASAEYITLATNRRKSAMAVSCSLGVAYAYVGAGEGESGTDGLYAGARLVASGGEIVAEAELFSPDALLCDVALDSQISAKKIINEVPRVTKTPFIPEDECERKEALSLALEIQARALAHRIERSYSKCAVLGVSGGLDSTLAVLVAARYGYTRTPKRGGNSNNDALLRHHRAYQE
jgi:NAD+ synthase (glutamine-hydrolysing)